jgi:hypothetical protein
VQRRERRRTAALGSAVVEDGHARREGTQCHRIGGIGAAVMGDQIDVDVAEEIGGTRQREERRAGQVAEVEKREPAKRQQKPHRPRILIDLLRRQRRFARWVPPPGLSQRPADRPAIGAHDDGVKAIGL